MNEYLLSKWIHPRLGSKKRYHRHFAAWAFLVSLLALVIYLYQFNQPPPLPREYSIEILAERGVFSIDTPIEINNSGDLVGVGSARRGSDDLSSVGLLLDRRGEVHLAPIWGGNIHINDFLQVDGITGGTPREPHGRRFQMDASGDFEPASLGLPKHFERSYPIANNNLGDTLILGYDPQDQSKDGHWFLDAEKKLEKVSIGQVEGATPNGKCHFNAMNDQRVLAGFMSGYAGVDRTPVVWSATRGLQVLNMSEENPSAELCSINNNGVGLGSYTKTETDWAFTWSEEEGIHHLHQDPFPGVWPFEINNHNQAVGAYSEWFADPGYFKVKDSEWYGYKKWWARLNQKLPKGWRLPYPDRTLRYVSEAFLYEDGTFYDLNAALPWDSEFERLIYAKDINDRGQIIGVGLIAGEERGFLMTPVEGDR